MFWKYEKGNPVAFTEPFRHWVFDDFLPKALAERLYQDYPEPTDEWYRYENHFEVKRATDKLELMPEMHVQILTAFNTNLFMEGLEKITGIEGLIPDPAFRGGGLHYIKQGGSLGIHADFNWHKKLKLHRRLNVLLYLNKGYEELYGGQLELWDKEMKSCVRRIKPKFNRLVIFETTDTSFHGHPEPWACSVPRRSIAWYFYSVERPAHEISQPHSTLFQKLPGEVTTPEIEALRIKRNEGRL